MRALTHNQTKRTYIGIGGNVGNVAATMCSAVGLLSENSSIDLIASSPLYKTPPWGDENQDWFINACFSIETSLQPVDLLDALKQVEIRLKRKKTRRWGPRTIDLDILWMEGVTFSNERLMIPHPRMTERAFVLVPLSDIARQDLMINGQKLDYWLKQIDAPEIKKMPTNQDWRSLFNKD